MKQQATFLAVLASLILASSPIPAAAQAKAKPAAAKAVPKPAAKPAAPAAKPDPKVAEAPPADPLNPLGAADIAAYRAAFAAAERGEDAKRTAALAKVSNGALKGRVAYAGLVRRGEKPGYPALTAWLASFSDHAGAERIYDLALKARPRKAKAPRAPAIFLATGGGSAVSSDKGQSAREAYYSGDVRKALTLALAAGERWIAGLSAYRLDRFGDARAQFAVLASDKATDPWLRSAAAYWAGRSADRGGAMSEKTRFLKMAAELPETFYGMIAERQLAMAGIDVVGDPIADLLAGVSDDGRAAAARFAAAEPRARRAAALAQVGRPADAGEELRAGLALAKTEAARDSWMALALALNPQGAGVKAPVVSRTVMRRADAGSFPLPALEPKGGFTLDPALVYALVRQESGFNALAISSAGAVGLMQLMPAAAARAAGDDKLIDDMSPLFDPAMNLRVGQDYFTWLMERGLNNFDLLRAVAAYNGGPGTLTRAAAQLGPNADSLLLIESLPALETRNYVEKVTAAYWTYRRLFGLPSGTLDALAAGEKTADIRLDAKAAPPSPAA